MSWIALLLMFWSVPPEALLLLPASPITIRPPLGPVLFRMIPFAPPLAEILRKIRFPAPMDVLTTFSAVPVVVIRVLVAFVALTMPPPVALKAGLAPVESVSAPMKLTVEPVFALRLTPVPDPLIAPLKVAVPPVLLAILTERAALLPIVPA